MTNRLAGEGILSSSCLTVRASTMDLIVSNQSRELDYYGQN